MYRKNTAGSFFLTKWVLLAAERLRLLFKKEKKKEATPCPCPWSRCPGPCLVRGRPRPRARGEREEIHTCSRPGPGSGNCAGPVRGRRGCAAGLWLLARPREVLSAVLGFSRCALGIFGAACCRLPSRGLCAMLSTLRYPS